jgi:hypothetical protein
MDVAADSAQPEEGRTWVGSGLELCAVMGFDVHVAAVEHRAFAGLREVMEDGVLLDDLDLKGEVRELAAGEALG